MVHSSKQRIAGRRELQRRMKREKRERERAAALKESGKLERKEERAYRKTLDNRTPAEWIGLIDALDDKLILGLVAHIVFFTFAPRCPIPEEKPGDHTAWLALREAFPSVRDRIFSGEELVDALMNLGLRQSHAESIAKNTDK